MYLEVNSKQSTALHVCLRISAKSQIARLLHKATQSGNKGDIEGGNPKVEQM